MRTVFFGNGPRGVRCLDALLSHNHQVVAIVGHKQTADVVLRGQEFGIPVFYPNKVNAPAFITDIQKHAPDLFVLAGYNQILHKKIISMPPLGSLNLHGGKLPEYRGVAPINWQIIRGETQGGCCVIFVDEGIDTGDIVEQSYYEIGPNETAGDIVNKQLELFPPMLLRALNRIKSGTIKSKKQNPKEGSYFTRRYPKDSHLNWQSLTAQEAHNLIRAMQGPGYPPAFSYCNDIKVELHTSQILSEDIQGIPGRIALTRKNGIIVIAKDRGLLLTRISMNDSPSTNPRHLLATGEDFV